MNGPRFHGWAAMPAILLAAGLADAATINPGKDYWRTPPNGDGNFVTTLYVILPAGLFRPTSLKYEGYLWVQGDAGAPQVCPTDPLGADVVLNRPIAAQLSVGDTAMIPVTIERMDFVKNAPGVITVSFSDRGDENWNVGIQLQPGTFGGDMTITQSDASGGTFDMRLFPKFRLTFSRFESDPTPVFDMCNCTPVAYEDIPWKLRTPLAGSCTSNFKVSAPGPFHFHGFNLDWIAAPAAITDAPVTVPGAGGACVGILALALAIGGAHRMRVAMWKTRERRRATGSTG